MAKVARLQQIAPGYYMVCRSESDEKELERNLQQILSEGRPVGKEVDTKEEAKGKAKT